MNLIRLALLFWVNKPYSVALRTLLITIPVALFICVGVIKKQTTSRLLKHTENIDLILGASGNPVQITLSGLLLTGNPGTISVGDARKTVRNRAVRLAVPVILEDYYKGFRLIGTNHNYLDIYKTSIREGRIWDDEMEIVLGHSAARKLGMDIGDILSLEKESEEGLDQDKIQLFKVVGILERTKTVLDKVMITSLESIWGVEEQFDVHDIIERDTVHMENDKPYDIFPFDFPDRMNNRLSCVLIQYRSQMAALAYPKYVKRESGLQPVVPGIEMLRFIGTINHILSYFIVFAYILICIAGFSIVLYFRNILEDNQADFAVFRAIGCSRHKIAYLVLLQALFIADTAAFAGIIIGHISAQIVATTLPFARMADISGWVFYGSEISIYLAVHILTLLIASYSTYQAYKLNVKSIMDVS